MLLREFCVRRGGVLADADDLRSDRLEFVIQGGEGVCLTGAAGCVVSGIEVDNYLLPSEFREASFLSVLVGQGESGCLGSCFEHNESYLLMG